MGESSSEARRAGTHRDGAEQPAAWAPPRPPASSVVWGAGDPASRRLPASTEPGPPPFVGDDAIPTFVAARPRAGGGSRRLAGRGRITRFWATISLGRRILLSYAGLASVIVLVTFVGAALQPSYGSLTPWQGIRVDDVRSAPATSPWAVDLASTLAPGAPPECLRFTAVDVGQDLAAVRADSAWTYGFSEDSVCSVVPEGFRSRVALLDTASGDVRWVHDVASDLTTSDGVSITWLSTVDRASRLLVRAGTSSQSIIESLSLGSGQVLETTGTTRWTQEDRFTASGDVVATGSLSADDLSYVYELRNVDDLSRVVWRGTGNETATMIALDDRLLLGDSGTLSIPLATGVPTRWGGPVDTSLGYAVHDDVVFAARTSGSGVTVRARGGFSAVDRTGHVLWTSSLNLRGSYSLTRSCLAVTNRVGDRLTCLDYRTGKALWSDDVGAFSYAGSALGQRSDDIYTVSTTERSRVVAIDGATGRQRWAADVPSGAYVVAAGHTVAYALAYGISGSRSSVIALDLSSGKRLWSHASQLQLSLWGGHLIDVGIDGLARRLT